MDQISFDMPGYWIDCIDNDTPMVECSVCGCRNIVHPYLYKPWPWTFCYGCGTRMENAKPPRKKKSF